MNSSTVKTLQSLRRYRLVCTLSFGDIYGQIITWLLVIFLSLAAAMAMMGLLEPVWRLPMVPPSPASESRIRAVLSQCGLLKEQAQHASR